MNFETRIVDGRVEIEFGGGGMELDDLEGVMRGIEEGQKCIFCFAILDESDGSKYHCRKCDNTGGEYMYCYNCDLVKVRNEFPSLSNLYKCRYKCKKCSNEERKDNMNEVRHGILCALCKVEVTNKNRYCSSFLCMDCVDNINKNDPKITRIYCNKCENKKDVKFFKPKPGTALGYSTSCRECVLSSKALHRKQFK